jgi:ABC-type uncharacterized transport system permease subunit
METYALLIASTLNAGTVLALAAMGLLINEKAGIVNLGAEGMMLCAAHGGLRHRGAHRQRPRSGFAGRGMAAGALLAGIFGLLGDLAEHQPVRQRPGPEPVRRRASRPSSGTALRAGEAAGAEPQFAIPLAGRHPAGGPGAVPAAPAWSTSAWRWCLGLIWFLYRSRAGLVLRSRGRKSPESAHALGYDGARASAWWR